MKIGKRLLGGLAIACVMLVALGVLLVWHAGQSGSSSIEQWIGTQFQLISNSYLEPRLSFDDLDYQYPMTVRLSRMRLTADDPARPGEKIDILAAEDATIEL